MASTIAARSEYDAEVQRISGGWEARLAAIAGGAIRVSIDRPGITHIDLSDEPFWDGSMTPESRPNKLATIADTRTWIRAFFDGTVRGDRASLQALAIEPSQSKPEVNVHVFGRMWP